MKKFQRQPNMSIDNYIIEFERLHNQVINHKIYLPDPVLAYRLLESANLSASKSALVRSTVAKLAYADMKIQLRKLIDSTSGASNLRCEIPHVKEEPVFETEQTYSSRGFQKRGRGASRGYGRVRGAGRGFGRGIKQNWKNDKDKTNKNPQDSAGKFTSFLCKSVYHWKEAESQEILISEAQPSFELIDAK